MLTKSILLQGKCIRTFSQRNIGASSVLLQKATDPIQQLFVDKLKEYKKKSLAVNGGMVDVTPEVTAQLERELLKTANQYGGGGEHMTEFPKFNFSEAVIDNQMPRDETVKKITDQAKNIDSLTLDILTGGNPEPQKA